MKAYLLVVALAVAPACGKQNDVAVLEHEAVTLAKYYQPKVDALDARAQALFERGKASKVPEGYVQLDEARQKIGELRGIIGPEKDGKSALEKEAAAAAKDGKVNDLKKLVDDKEAEIANRLTIINADLDTAESVIVNYERKTLVLAPGAQPPAGEAPQPTGGTEPGTPEAQATPQTGQPPSAAQPQQGSAAPQQGSAAQPKPQAGSAAEQKK